MPPLRAYGAPRPLHATLRRPPTGPPGQHPHSTPRVAAPPGAGRPTCGAAPRWLAPLPPRGRKPPPAAGTLV